MQEYYIKLKDFSLLYNHYAYVDVPEYLADQLFAKHSVYVYYDSEFAHPEHGYRIIKCHVAKWRRKGFEAALNDLPTLMAMAGKSDYLDFSRALVADLSERQAKERQSKRSHKK